MLYQNQVVIYIKKSSPKLWITRHFIFPLNGSFNVIYWRQIPIFFSKFVRTLFTTVQENQGARVNFVPYISLQKNNSTETYVSRDP